MRCIVLGCMALLLAAPFAQAQTPGPQASAGPGRIICRTAKTCQLGIGDPAHQISDRYRGVAGGGSGSSEQTMQAGREDALYRDRHRIEMGDALKVKATAIKWYN